jgi:hypothetical protein
VKEPQYDQFQYKSEFLYLKSMFKKFLSLKEVLRQRQKIKKIKIFVGKISMSGHSPGSRAGSDQSGGPPSSNPGPGGHQVDLHVMYSAFRSQHQTPSVGESIQFLSFLDKKVSFSSNKSLSRSW